MLLKWFFDNQMKTNISKCYLLVNKKDEFLINLGETKIKNSEYEKLLGIKVDTKQVQLQWIPGNSKWKLQTRIFLIVPML